MYLLKCGVNCAFNLICKPMHQDKKQSQLGNLDCKREKSVKVKRKLKSERRVSGKDEKGTERITMETEQKK